MKFRVLIGLLCSLALAGSSAQSDQSETETVTLRVECRKENDRGCTAASTQIWTAPNGRYIDIASLGAGTINNYWLKNPACGVAEVATFTNITVPGLPTPVLLPISFRDPLHVESGAGLKDLGKVAYVNCTYTVKTYPIPSR